VDYLETVKNGFEHDWGDEKIRYSFDHPYCSQHYKPQAPGQNHEKNLD
jgi:hypothetical protein